MATKRTREVWRDIPGYEGRYQASNLGNIRSMNYGNRKGVVRKLKKRSNGKGYDVVYISDGERKAKNRKVHQLVALAFVPNPHGYPCINHKDENKRNCAAKNLEWCTIKYNNNYGTVKERISATKKLIPDVTKKAIEACKKKVVKFTVDGEKIAEYDSVADAARIEHIDKSCISKCCRGVRKTAYGHIWEYKEDIAVLSEMILKAEKTEMLA